MVLRLAGPCRRENSATWPRPDGSPLNCVYSSMASSWFRLGYRSSIAGAVSPAMSRCQPPLHFLDQRGRQAALLVEPILLGAVRNAAQRDLASRLPCSGPLSRLSAMPMPPRSAITRAELLRHHRFPHVAGHALAVHVFRRPSASSTARRSAAPSPRNPRRIWASVCIGRDVPARAANS